MSDDWSKTKLAKIADVRDSKVVPTPGDTRPYVGLEHIAQGQPKLLGIGRAGDVVSHKTTFQAGDILYGKLRPNLRKVVRVDFSGVCSTDILVIHPHNPVDGPFLQHLLASDDVLSVALRSAAGTKMPRTSWDDLRNYAFLCPPPHERACIAERLDAIDAAIEKTEAVIAETERLRRGLLQDLLTNGVPGLHRNVRNTSLGEIPDAWDLLKVQDFASSAPRSIQSGPFGSALKHSEFQKSGALVIGIDNVLDGRFSIGRQNRISESKFEELQVFQARPEDVLITVMATVGRSCVVPKNLEPAIITKHVYRITVNPSLCLPEFLMWSFLASPLVLRQLYGSSQGQTRPGLNGELIKSVKIPLPGLDEQKEICTLVSAVDKRVVREQDALLTLQDLKSASADALLTGTVRVPFREGVTT